MNHGDVYWVNLDPTVGAEIKKQRPCVVISSSTINRARHTVVVVPLSTSAQPNPPLVVAVKCLGKLNGVVCDQLRAVDKSRLIGSKADTLSAKDTLAIEEGLRQVLCL